VGKGLDPEFNFMEVAKPFAMQLMTDGRTSAEGGSLLNELSRQAVQYGNTAFGLPRRIEDTLDKLERGDLRVRVRSTETDRILRRISGVNMGTNYTLLTCAFTVSATILLVNQLFWVAGIAAVAAVVSSISLIRLMMKLDHYDRLP
jgi:predicted unusual protein kinase regulating ubiquinone biosynthesis (AarF/ABC1/UbiB family)